MKQDSKLPPSPKDPPPPNRPSHERVIEYLDKWANSPGLQPPKSAHPGKGSMAAPRRIQVADHPKEETPTR